MERARRRSVAGAVGALLTCALSLTLIGCAGPGYPPTVVVGSELAVAWTEVATSVNAASSAGEGDLEIEQLTRSQFARERAGRVEFDPAFGSVEITEESEASFTLSYDLEQPQWSDRIAVDAADLLLAWAAGSNFFAADGSEADDAASTADDEEPTTPGADDPLRFDSVPTGMVLSDEIPEYDEFDRRMDVHFSRPFHGWETALDVAVPAHLVGRYALGVDDPMAAKHAVVQAITGSDTSALEKIVALWNTGFALDAERIPREDLFLSSGPYRIEQVDGDREDPEQRVLLRANPAYVSARSAGYESIILQRDLGEDVQDAIGEEYDVVEVAPRPDNFESIRQLDRNDYGVDDIHHGFVWVVQANTAAPRPLSDRNARSVLMRSFDRGDVADGGAGGWADIFSSASSVLFPPGTAEYQVAVEDAGFGAAFRSATDADDLRIAAGVASGIRLCVLYDRGSAIAKGMFASFRTQVAEGGWIATDCSSDEPDEVAANSDDWDIYLGTKPFPATVDELRAQWGSGGSQNYSGSSDGDRDALIDRLDAETDRYEARDIRVAIEKTIVDQMVIAPLAIAPIVMISDRDVEGVAPRSSRHGALLDRAFSWHPVDAAPSTPQEDVEDEEDSGLGLF